MLCFNITNFKMCIDAIVIKQMLTYMYCFDKESEDNLELDERNGLLVFFLYSTHCGGIYLKIHL